MSEIEITLPTVTYGNVKVRATPEELGVNDISDAYELGVASAVYLNLFQQGFKHGATLDVSAPQGASQEVSEAEAQELLDKGLGGVTEVPDESTYKSLDEQADTMTKSEGEAPWNQKVDTPKKPWETDGVTAPVVLDASW